MTALGNARRYVLTCTWGLTIVAMVVVGLMMLTITYDVLARFIFSAPTDWAYPVNSAGVLVSTSLAVPYLYAKGRHISMDLLYRALSQRGRSVCGWITAAATGVLGLVLAVTAFRSMTVAIEGGLTGSGTFSIPLWIPDAVLALTGALLLLVAVLFPPHLADEAPVGDEEGATAPEQTEEPTGAPPRQPDDTGSPPSENRPARDAQEGASS